MTAAGELDAQTQLTDSIASFDRHRAELYSMHTRGGLQRLQRGCMMQQTSGSYIVLGLRMLTCAYADVACLQNNPSAFSLSEHQKLEGAQALHMEETRVKMMMAIGQIPPLDEAGMLQHLHEFALEVSWEALRADSTCLHVARPCQHKLSNGSLTCLARQFVGARLWGVICC